MTELEQLRRLAAVGRDISLCRDAAAAARLAVEGAAAIAEADTALLWVSREGEAARVPAALGLPEPAAADLASRSALSPESIRAALGLRPDDPLLCLPLAHGRVGGLLVTCSRPRSRLVPRSHPADPRQGDARGPRGPGRRRAGPAPVGGVP